MSIRRMNCPGCDLAVNVPAAMANVNESDAKVWDDCPESNAVRNGKCVYSKEMSEGWEKNPNWI